MSALSGAGDEIQPARCSVATGARSLVGKTFVKVQGMRVNTVYPGCGNTLMGNAIDPEAMKGFFKQQPIGRMGRNEDVAVCSLGASFIIALPIDGGFVAH